MFAEGDGDGLCAVGGAELFEDGREMELDASLPDGELLGDVFTCPKSSAFLPLFLCLPRWLFFQIGNQKQYLRLVSTLFFLPYTLSF